jgi:chemotaxis signal transduction protein
MPEVTPVPRSPAYVAGVCNLRGNVLPVIDTRTRFSMAADQQGRDGRLLVVETDGSLTGLVVDNVREVMQLDENSIEPPPEVCGDMESAFLQGVVKSAVDQRIVLVLNIAEVIKVNQSKQKQAASVDSARNEQQQRQEQVDEEQLVTFMVAKEEYAFQIERVREIFRLQGITQVPNVPAYVKGIYTLRNQLMPIIDLRNLLGLSSMEHEMNGVIDRLLADTEQWNTALQHAIQYQTKFTGVTQLKESAFGKWMEAYSTSNSDIQDAFKRLKKLHIGLFRAALNALRISVTSADDGMAYYHREIGTALESIRARLSDLKLTIAENLTDDQRVMVVESGEVTVGYLVDSVNEVVRIPKSVIETTPTMARSDRHEIMGVAKLDNGKRLIMIMDESSLVIKDAVSTLEKHADTLQSDTGEIPHEQTLGEQAQEEDQLVTFSIGKEEFGVPVMQVQEINRLTDITSVPRSPSYVDGVTNLRGSIVPVTNVRRFFGLTARDNDDRTRIIIVDMQGVKTGLCVDQVNEVLRIARSSIEPTPAIVIAGGGNEYMNGMCKLDDGKRMIVILDLHRMLDQQELAAVGVGSDPSDPSTPTTTKPKASRRRKALAA